MNTIQVLIVDDEPPARDELAYLLAGYPDVETAQARNAGEALEAIRARTPDVVFLDIHMPGKDGFHVLKEALRLPEPPEFVFVTAYDKYAVRAFDENALDYLLKPVSDSRLQVTMGRVREQLRRRDGEESSRARLEKMLLAVGQPQSVERVTVEKGGRIHLVSADKIHYCESMGRKIVVHFKDESLPCHGVASLDDLADRLGSLPMLKINRKTLVNVDRIREYAPWTHGRYCLVLDDDASTELVLSRGRVKDFKRILGL